MILSPSLLAWGRNHIRGIEDNMINKINPRCKHCNGTVIQKYDRIYCIQCSREPNSSTPQITNEEYIQNKRGDDSIRQRINSAALERGG